MAHTITVLTLQLAQAIGLYLVAVGLGLVLFPARWTSIVDELERSAVLTMVAGAASFWIGAGILIAHHHTIDTLALVVTLFGIVAVVKGVLILAFPTPMFAFYRPFLRPARILGIVALVAGAVLFLCGFTGRADAFPQGVV
jgi:uncharacterized protein YjeT (DUF2065 family)